ncbi:uncharacterized protein [Diabrotica undecimpunctata]|uniref:uncharacterized protein n=1 Tax=Diabrotica undecimpunctata TaxID=50387 RepID=UPI003B63FAEF
MESEEFRVNDSLRQGGVLGLIMFNIVLDDVMKETREETSRIFVEHRNLEMIQIAECAFSDDLVIFGRNEDALKRNLQIWRNKLEKRNLRINESKTKVMDNGIKVGNAVLDRVKKLVFLGSNINVSWDPAIEIKSRIEQTRATFVKMRNVFVATI